MALMLEIRDASGAVTRRRLDHSSLAIGRALSNDIILDDPYADAQHARLRVDDTGTLVLEDLGSLNGLQVGDESAPAVAITPGTIVRVGRTTFHFRDIDEPVAPALREKAPEVVATPPFPAREPAGRLEHIEQRLSDIIFSKRGRIVIAVSELVVGGTAAWMNDYSRNVSTALLGALVVIIGLQTVWASVWSVATRGSARRPTFSANYSVIALAATTGIIVAHVGTLVNFLFPASEWGDALVGIVLLSLLATLVSAHLAVGNVSTRRKRWRAGWITSGSVLALTIVIGLLATEKTNSVPSFAHDIVPLPASAIPAQSLDRISDDLADLKKDVDAASEKEGVTGNR